MICFMRTCDEKKMLDICFKWILNGFIVVLWAVVFLGGMICALFVFIEDLFVIICFYFVLASQANPHGSTVTMAVKHFQRIVI